MILEATRLRFNGVVIETDNYDLEATALVALDIVISFFVQLNLLAMELRSLVQLQTIIARRVIAGMDTARMIIEIIMAVPGRMAEDWVRFWFKMAWRY